MVWVSGEMCPSTIVIVIVKIAYRFVNGDREQSIVIAQIAYLFEDILNAAIQL